MLTPSDRDAKSPTSDKEVNRREFIATSGGVAAAASIAGRVSMANDQHKGGQAIELVQSQCAGRTKSLDLAINHQPYSVSIDARATLLDLLREQLELTGTKKGCDHGACGACTVHVGGRRVLACMTLAATVEGQDVTTIEGMATKEELHPLQQAFLDCEGFQCGYCTPGQIMSAAACIKEGHVANDQETREWMSGNLCRCGAYPNIVDAINQVKSQ